MNNYINFLPTYLVENYKKWKLGEYEEDKLWYKKIASEGQNPKSMIISCCDARVHVTSIFGAEKGEFFIHRNIANLVPPYNPKGDHHGTSAALEYAVKMLNVKNIIILGHSQCGGIDSGYKACSNNIAAKDTIFINKWLNILEPAYKKILKSNILNYQDGVNKLEKESIKTSIDNLVEFPFIKNLLKEKKIQLHGLWHDIGSGNLEALDPISLKFIKI